MAASKNGNHIRVDGTGNTLSSITADIADTTYIEETSPGVFTIKCNVQRNILIYGELTIGDPNDFSVYERLEFDQAVSIYGRLYVNPGAHFKMYGNTEIDFVTHPTNRAYYTYWYGSATIQGDATYKPKFINYRRQFFYENQNNDTYYDIWHFDNMIFASPDAANEYAIYFQSMGKIRPHSFTNIIFDKTLGGRGYQMYTLYIPVGMNGLEQVTFENLHFDNVGNYPIFMNSAGSQEFKNCEFHTTTNFKVYILGRFHENAIQVLPSYGTKSPEPFAQNFVFLNSCLFGPEANVNQIYVNQGACVLLKDCEFQHTTGETFQVQNQSILMMWTGNTFTGGREFYDIDFGSAVQWVYGLDLTILDEDGNPVDDAKIGIVQSEDKETYTFRTDSNGKIYNHFNIGIALLCHKSQYGDNKAVDFEYWSDASNGTYHIIRVFKMGYRPVEKVYVMDSDKSDTITLQRIDAHASTF